MFISFATPRIPFQCWYHDHHTTSSIRSLGPCVSFGLDLKYNLIRCRPACATATSVVVCHFMSSRSTFPHPLPSFILPLFHQTPSSFQTLPPFLSLLTSFRRPLPSVCLIFSFSSSSPKCARPCSLRWAASTKPLHKLCHAPPLCHCCTLTLLVDGFRGAFGFDLRFSKISVSLRSPSSYIRLQFFAWSVAVRVASGCWYHPHVVYFS